MPTHQLQPFDDVLSLEPPPTHSHKHSHKHSHGHSHEHDDEAHWLKAAFGLTWGIALLILSIVSFNIPLLAYYIITGLTSLITLYLGQSVYKSAWKALLDRRWETTSLYALSTLTILALSVISVFVPGLPMMFEAAPFVLGFWHLSEGIEHTLIEKIENQLDVRDCVPPLVLLKGNPDTETSVKKLVPNDRILIKKGAVIPVDGVLTEKALLYTTRVDGSPELKAFYPGDAVKAGMRLADHIPSVEMRVTKTYKNSYLSLIAKNIRQANDEKAPVEVVANRILKYFIPGLIGIALISGITIGLLFTPALAFQCVVSVLVSACPCALSLITPMAVKIGMKKAADNGIHFNNGKALQAASDIDAVVFDLNGTFTKGAIEVSSWQISNKKYWRHIALLEHQSDHPVAQIIASFAESQSVKSSTFLELTSIDKSHHSGIKGTINGVTYMIGNQDMMLANGLEPGDPLEESSIYIVRGTTVIGQINLKDPLRDDALATVNQLKRLGKQVHLCTGAAQATANHYAELLGISEQHICANTVGADGGNEEVSKASYIETLQRRGYKVAMVGDAANDLAAIARSDLGIAVKSSIGDDITEQHAGIVIQQGFLFPIATAFEVGKKTKHNIMQNLLISLSYNSAITLVAAGLFVALGFTLNPVAGIALMVLESTIVLANLYRFKQHVVESSPVLNQGEALDAEVYGNSTFQLLERMEYLPKPDASVTQRTHADDPDSENRNGFAPDRSHSFHVEKHEHYGLSACNAPRQPDPDDESEADWALRENWG